MGAKSDNFCLFSAYFDVFSPVLWLEYRIFISIVDISANLENIDIDIDKAILKISISIGLFWKISISIKRFWKISISISIRRFWKISISIKYCIDWNLAYQTGLTARVSLFYSKSSLFNRFVSNQTILIGGVFCVLCCRRRLTLPVVTEHKAPS